MRSVSSRAAHAALPLIFAAAVGGGCTPAGSQTSTGALDAIGCQFEAKKVCEQSSTRPVNFSSGITTSNQSYFQQNAPATVWEQVPIKAPGGSEVDVQCQVDTQNKVVVYAYATPSGSVSDGDRERLKDAGFCRGVPATLTAPSVRAKE
ncbi:MAG: hypothetical protein JO121_24455 [Deltaproteobacteria bacterium]|nr:hypothetical protein [Deltaproteobacteria bacterium]